MPFGVEDDNAVFTTRIAHAQANSAHPRSLKIRKACLQAPFVRPRVFRAILPAKAGPTISAFKHAEHDLGLVSGNRLGAGNDNLCTMISV